MPHVIIKLYSGRSAAEKTKLAEDVAAALIASIGAREPSISVAIEDVAPEDWAEQVYKPEILARPERIYKKPGYNPF